MTTIDPALYLLVFFLLFSEFNLFAYARFSVKPVDRYPLVSILVPCRNEEKRIRPNLWSLLRQEYPSFEVIVLDDNSEDGTGRILAEIGRQSDRLRILHGKPLPDGWTGKNHACDQLSQAASGEWILFVDADTHHHPHMLKTAMQSVLERQAVFLSTFPRQRFARWGDELLVPIMPFVLMSFLPVYFVAKKTWRWLGEISAGCGQFLLFRKDVYETIGGHQAIKDKISEGPLLAARTKATGNRILVLDGSPWVSCQMYSGFREAMDGFTRSVFASMGGSATAILFFLVLQTYIFIYPYAILLDGIFTGRFFSPSVVTSFVCVLIPLWVRFRIHHRFGMRRRLIILHGLSMMIYNCVIVISMIHFKIRKTTVWKNRSYVNPQA